ncbi:hypothetical protein GO491_01365 [Flavobacteriaceae bacterium Ap0902]|nr:hypothetical protein [Flavobacteriaceae bacterium Ap0902]
MKKIITILMLCSWIMANAQQVSDYQYISVPNKFSDFDANQFSLNNTLKILLKKRNYEPLGENKNYWPEEVKLNPCRVLTADVFNTSSFLKNKLTLVLKDCNDEVVLKEEAISDIKAYKEGYTDALQQIVATMQISDAQDDIVTPAVQEVTIIEKTTQPAEYQKMLPEERQTKPMTTTKVITDNNQPMKTNDLKITHLDNGEIMVIDTKKSLILAHYYPSTRTGIYHVKITAKNGMGYYTIGYKNQDGTLSYERTRDFQTWTLTTFN